MKQPYSYSLGIVGIGLFALGAVSSYQGQTVFTAATITTLTATTANITTTNSSGVLSIANGSVGTPSLALTSSSNTGFYYVSGTRLGVTANGKQQMFVDDGTVHIRPTAVGSAVFAVGTASAADWQVDTSNNVFGVMTSGQVPVEATKIGTLYFCGLGPNGATATYMAPTLSLAWGGRSATDATACVGGSSTTEATADFPMFPYAIVPVSMKCGSEDKANTNNATMTFTLRSATADVGTVLTCTTAAFAASGQKSCGAIHGPGSATDSIASGATIAMKAVMSAANDESTGNMWCVLTYSWR